MFRLLPNLLTILRMLAVVPVAILAYWPDPRIQLLAVAVFLLACVTDFLDGFLARAMGVQSVLGRILDPIADKILTIGIIMVLVDLDGIPIIPAVALVLRDILVSGLREYLAVHNTVIRSSRLAKWKTALEMTALTALLVAICSFTDSYIEIIRSAGDVLIWLAAVTSVISAWTYLRLSMRRLQGS